MWGPLPHKIVKKKFTAKLLLGRAKEVNISSHKSIKPC